MLYTQKYNPTISKDVIGQDVQTIKLFVENYKKGKYLLICGPSGTGKTSTVYSIANELDLEIIELNSSDLRNKNALNDIIGKSMQQQSLFNKGKIILIDEVDTISGRYDYGGLSTLKTLIEKSPHPIILTATNMDDDKLKSLKKKSVFVEFKKVNYKIIFEVLKKICDNEKIKFTEHALTIIARKAGGDLRAALNDLQTLASSKEIVVDDANNLDERKQEAKIQEGLFRVFKTSDPQVALSSFDEVDINTDDLILWIEENTPIEYTKNEDLERAFDFLSKADIYRGRIRRQQYWRFLFYINQFLTAGIALSKGEKYKNINKYNRSMKLLKFWQTARKNDIKKKLSEEMAEKMHFSKREFITDFYYFFEIFSKDKKLFEQIKKDFELKF